jgi:hypothetical protein
MQSGKGRRLLVARIGFVYVSGMRSFLAVPLCLLPLSAVAAAAPHSLGSFGAWTAATYGSGTDKACYAFTPAKNSSPALSKRGQVMLTVTERASAADEVTLSAGYVYPKNPKVTLTVGSSAINFYTSGQTAFTTAGAQAVAAFQAGAMAVAKSSGPNGTTVTDSFSLAGFSGAYAAIKKACS